LSLPSSSSPNPKPSNNHRGNRNEGVEEVEEIDLVFVVVVVVVMSLIDENVDEEEFND
jgi:hypothetical protein